jgi:hypothetical protein
VAVKPEASRLSLSISLEYIRMAPFVADSTIFGPVSPHHLAPHRRETPTSANNRPTRLGAASLQSQLRADRHGVVRVEEQPNTTTPPAPMPCQR